MSNNYITTQGDTWDIISLRVYNDEKLMHLLVEANPQYRDTAVFSANAQIVIPDVSRKQRVNFPPWRAS